MPRTSAVRSLFPLTGKEDGANVLLDDVIEANHSDFAVMG